MKRRILVVEDEAHIAEALTLNLEMGGYQVVVAHDGSTGYDLAKDGAADLVILDIMLPEMDGLTVCQNLRRDGVHLPILFLTAKSRDEDKIKGLEAGGELAQLEIEQTLGYVSSFSRLERITDQAKNICEQTIFAATGESKKAKDYNILFLDEATGYEHIYAVFSATPWPALEQAFSEESQMMASPSSDKTEPPLLAAVVRGPNGLLDRGVGGWREDESLSETTLTLLVERTIEDGVYQVSCSSDPLQATGSFLVVERWFRHDNPD